MFRRAYSVEGCWQSCSYCCLSVNVGQGESTWHWGWWTAYPSGLFHHWESAHPNTRHLPWQANNVGQHRCFDILSVGHFLACYSLALVPSFSYRRSDYNRRSASPGYDRRGRSSYSRSRSRSYSPRKLKTAAGLLAVPKLCICLDPYSGQHFPHSHRLA